MAGSASNIGALALNHYAQALCATAGIRNAALLLSAEVTVEFDVTVQAIDMFIASV